VREEERERVIREMLPEEKRIIYDEPCYDSAHDDGFNSCRQQIIKLAKKYNIKL